jgi:organic hydroperoxide reductase OsmC/OhrA
VASVEVCTLTTFLFLMERLRGALVSYESTAEGTAQMVDRVFVFRDVVVSANVKVPSEEDARKALKAFSEIQDWCLVTKSVRCEVKVEPQVSVG